MKRTFITIALLTIPIIVSATHNFTEPNKGTVVKSEFKDTNPTGQNSPTPPNYVQIITTEEHELELKNKQLEEREASHKTTNKQTDTKSTQPQKEISETKNIITKPSKKERRDFSVPFYSQFSDISDPSKQKIGCGVASLAMIIEYYNGDKISVDKLFETGLEAGAYLENAGWIHSGLINLSKKYKLDGESKYFSYLGKEGALAKLETALKAGPVLASVHYTFEPTNPIPHLVVINGFKDDIIYYNDPAEKTGGGTINKEKFLKAWKSRFIEIRPT